MIIEIDLNGIGKPLEQTIEEKLKKENIPSCLGHMSPSLLKGVIDIEGDDYFKMRYDIPEEDKVDDIDISKLTKSEFYLQSKRYSIDKPGINRLEVIKSKIVNDYIKHIKNCMSCKHDDICFKITTCYLMSLNINLD